MIQSIDRAAKILSLLQGARRLGITELGAALDLPPSTVHGIVKSLQAHGLVAQERGGNRYMLGPALVKLSSVYLDTLDVRARSIRWMHDLSSETGFATRLGVELFGEVLVIHHDRRPDGSEQMPETGLTLPSHASALGKVLLAFDADHRQDALDRPLRTLTGSTKTDPVELEAEFDRVRRESLGYELEEAVIGENSVAAPVYDASGAAIAALAIVVPSSEWPPPAPALTALTDAARSISRDLGAPARPAPAAPPRR
ncbi:IclR family transcriptional regulator [Herbiconiux sp. KACC 21604]|uniref:IclR family transcriptional regulator n=1 Tax=unclassified Herbiconiux TaxID=2618217 RepID=UPI001490C81C|nr:IclR family transcriptional regulator [Herbiconiux sp. SALV-R1]QJU52677.1 IclR family transcriptional regulator [Herbiconiux sp. SALV-R1]WPO87575.1 IclR family transcriptional regulator [Herbiconiux sp. KACC 21604]